MRPNWRRPVLIVLLRACIACGQTATGPELLPPPAAAPPVSQSSDQILATPLDGVPSTDAVIVPEDLFVDQGTSWYRPRHWLDPLPWDTGVEFGLNGSSGTSDSLSLRAGGYVKRESRFSKLDMSAYHNRTNNGGSVTQNNAQFDIRNDWLLDDASPWTLYGTSTVFYDEFQTFDLQTNANTGVGYRFIHDKELTLLARAGAGTSREIGGIDDRWVPESLFAFEYSQQLSPHQRVCTKLDYFPEWEELGEYRLVAEAAWEIELLQPPNMSLKISANDRFDSTPNGAEPHLVNYAVLLLLKL